MASTMKFIHAAMNDQNSHIDREHEHPRNADIAPERTHLNYSFPMDHNGLSPFQYYKNRIGEVYMYGRGSQREKDAITGCGWIVTLPDELYGNPEKEKAFFRGVFNFISDRYGKENIINNSIHYDEGGLPHIHVIFSPVTTLDHDMVQYKTKRTKQAVKLESGRWEYKYIHVNKNGRPVDENNLETWVKLNNYARMSDYYDEKVDCNSVLNPIELRNFHPDLQKYLTENGIEGKIVTGTTGTSFAVKELKEFTKKTGLHLKDIKELLPKNKSLLEGYIENAIKLEQINHSLHEKDTLIELLQKELSAKDQALSQALEHNSEPEKKIADLEKTAASRHQEQEPANIHTSQPERHSQEPQKRTFSWSKKEAPRKEQEVTF